MFDSLLIFF